jgi:hypothetical protein
VNPIDDNSNGKRTVKATGSKNTRRSPASKPQTTSGISIERLKRALIDTVSLTEEFPELLPLVLRFEREYDAALAHGSELSRVKARFGITDE